MLITIDKLDKIGAVGVATELRERSAAPEAVDALAEFLAREKGTVSGFDEEQIRAALPDGLEGEAIGALAAIGDAVAVARGGEAPLVFDPFLVRGMGYYTGTIFEIAHPLVSYSLGGGGRYDGMIGRFLGQDVPAVGFSLLPSPLPTTSTALPGSTANELRWQMRTREQKPGEQQQRARWTRRAHKWAPKR